MRIVLLQAVVTCLALTAPLHAQVDQKIIYRNDLQEVKQRQEQLRLVGNSNPLPLHTLLRDGIDFGGQLQDPRFRRLPTTYYHFRSPIGLVLQQYNWFGSFAGAQTLGLDELQASDARLPASLVALGIQPFHLGNLPTEQFAQLWSEPPVAIVGVHSGNLATYARPFQRLDVYEKNRRLLDLHLPSAGKEPYFSFLTDARQRGVDLHVLPGETRSTLTRKGPVGFYRVLVVEMVQDERLHKVAHQFITQEGMSECMKTLLEGGVLCYHISNRYLDLVPVIAATARSLNLSSLVGMDNDYDRRQETMGYTSQWVLVARRREHLAWLRPPDQYNERRGRPFPPRGDYWTEPVPKNRHVWTDGGKNSIEGLLRYHPLGRFVSEGTRNVREASCKALGLDNLLHYPNSRWFVETERQLGDIVSRISIGWQLRHQPSIQEFTR